MDAVKPDPNVALVPKSHEHHPNRSPDKSPSSGGVTSLTSQSAAAAGGAYFNWASFYFNDIS